MKGFRATEPRAPMPDGNCPQCKTYDLVKGEGRLDQSGQTYHLVTTWTCMDGEHVGCGYKTWEPAAPGSRLYRTLGKRGDRCACGRHLMNVDEVEGVAYREDDDRGGKHGWTKCPPEGM